MDLPSDSDESDFDFVPGGEVSASEESETEADRQLEAQYEGEVVLKKQRKRPSKGSTKKVLRKKTKRASDDEKESPVEIKPPTESEKKYEDDLWASFLGDSPKSKTIKDTPVKVVAKKDLKNDATTIVNDAPCVKLENNGSTHEEESISRLCDKPLFDIEKFEDIKEEKKMPEESKDKTAFPSSSGPVKGPVGIGSARGGGLSSILSRIGKKSTLSTLEKSKLDWNSFKKNEGIDEDIQVHNRGRGGYMERQDFLQRIDQRQFEIEKNFRTTKRSNR